MPDREKVIKGLEHHTNLGIGCTGCPYNGDCHQLPKDAIALLKEQPEIVLCKDCKHWGTSDCAMYNPFGNDEPTWDDWFCPIGERR